MELQRPVLPHLNKLMKSYVMGKLTFGGKTFKIWTNIFFL